MRIDYTESKQRNFTDNYYKLDRWGLFIHTGRQDGSTIPGIGA